MSAMKKIHPLTNYINNQSFSANKKSLLNFKRLFYGQR